MVWVQLLDVLEIFVEIKSALRFGFLDTQEGFMIIYECSWHFVIVLFQCDQGQACVNILVSGCGCYIGLVRCGCVPS